MNSAPDPAGYHRLKNALILGSFVWNTALLSVFAWLGFPGNILPSAPQTIQIAVFFLAWRLAAVPIRFLSGHRLERAYGMSRQSTAQWFGDDLRSTALALVIFTVVFQAFYLSAARIPNDAWWVLTLASFAFSAFGALVFPVWILPLFYKIEALPPTEKAFAARAALDRSGYAGLPLYLWRLGKKTSRANACLAGMGRTRRALLADTLLETHPEKEVALVVAHEAGHHRMGHIAKGLAIECAFTATGLFLFFHIISWMAGSANDLFAGTAYLPHFCLASFLGGWALAPVTHAVSRAFEREADAFALCRYPDKDVFISLMERLSAQNLSNPNPSHIEKWFLYTHPPTRERIACGLRFLERLRGTPSVALRFSPGQTKMNA